MNEAKINSFRQALKMSNQKDFNKSFNVCECNVLSSVY